MNQVVGAVPKISFARYLSPEYVRLEKERLWPNVWQIACREEEIPNPGDYLAYDVADSSIIVVRSRGGEIKAHHNVCLHRARRLVSGCGKANLFSCGYHGWKYDLDGRNIGVHDVEDWGGGLKCEDLRLKSVRVATWGGFVWVDMRPDGESLLEFLETVPEILGPYEYENMRYRWYVTLHIPCNWKVALEAFMEGYHVAATHPQMLRDGGDDRTVSQAQGKHGNFSYPYLAQTPLGQPSPRLNQPPPKDSRPGVVRYFGLLEETLKAVITERDYRAAQKIMEVLPEDADPFTALGTAVELSRQAALEEGAGWPEGVTMEHAAKAGVDWHIFPNCVTLPYFDAALFYRARPDGDDPDKCIFDIWSLARYAPGKEPPLERRLYIELDGADIGVVPNQDLSNLGEVQKGMKTGVLKEGLPNPVQEAVIINFHKTLDRYLGAFPA